MILAFSGSFIYVFYAGSVGKESNQGRYSIYNAICRHVEREVWYPAIESHRQFVIMSWLRLLNRRFLLFFYSSGQRILSALIYFMSYSFVCLFAVAGELLHIDYYYQNYQIHKASNEFEVAMRISAPSQKLDMKAMFSRGFVCIIFALLSWIGDNMACSLLHTLPVYPQLHAVGW